MLGKMDDAVSSLKIKPKYPPPPPTKKNCWSLCPRIHKNDQAGIGKGVPKPRDGRPVGNSARLLTLLSKTEGANWLNNSSSYVPQEMDWKKRWQRDLVSRSRQTANVICTTRPSFPSHIFNYSLLLRLVITTGYGVRATTIEGQNAFAPTLCFA